MVLTTVHRAAFAATGRGAFKRHVWPAGQIPPGSASTCCAEPDGHGGDPRSLLQRVQVDEPTVEYMPAGQRLHDLKFTREKVPAGQGACTRLKISIECRHIKR